MRDYTPDQGEHVHKIGEAEAYLARHEKRTRVVLILLCTLNAILLALVVDCLWDDAWMQESVRDLLP
ncbi:hypothetical protein [Microvirga sp. P5_D2]